MADLVEASSMRDDPQVVAGRPGSRDPSGLSPRSRAALDRVVARGTASLAPVAGVVTWFIAFRDSDAAMMGLAVAAVATGMVAIWQLQCDRPNAIVLNSLSAVIIGTATVFVPHNVAAGLAAGIIVFTLTGLPLVNGWAAIGYAALMLITWGAHPIFNHLIGEGFEQDLLAAYVIQFAILLFGLIVVKGIRRQLDNSENRYAYLFSHAPVALWENDFSRVGSWMAGLREQGVEDLRQYFADHPEDLRRVIMLVTTTNANPAAATLLGTDSEEDLTGPFPADVIDSESERLFREQFITLWEGTKGEDLEYAGRRFDGSRFHGILRWSNPAADGGGLARVVSAVSDVTGLRAIEEELESTETTTKALFDALPDLLFLCAADGTYLEYHVADRVESSRNGATESDLYVPPSAFLGKTPAEVLPPDLARQVMIAITTALETNTVQTCEYELPIGGEDRSWELRVAPLKGKPQVLCLVRDVTDQTIARRELERLVESKDDFIAAISHEIRTPLTGIIGYAHILLAEDGTLAENERRHMVETLVEQSADLSNIVEDLLVAAKADLGRLQIASVPTDLRAQAAQVLEVWDPRTVRNVELSGPSVKCVGDPARVRQIIRNLVTNAIRYGGDRIWIRVSAGPGMGSVVVADDGAGIPPAEVEDAFLPYHRAAARDGLTAALGIGLPISRTLARRMGGDLTYEHTAGEARFELTLPRAVADEPDAGSFPKHATAGIAVHGDGS